MDFCAPVSYTVYDVEWIVDIRSLSKFCLFRCDRFKIKDVVSASWISMEYLSDSSSDSESDHEDVQEDSTDVQDYPELSLVDDLRTSLHITDHDGRYSLFLSIHLSKNCKTKKKLHSTSIRTLRLSDFKLLCFPVSAHASVLASLLLPLQLFGTPYGHSQ